MWYIPSFVFMMIYFKGKAILLLSSLTNKVNTIATIQGD